MLHFTIRDLFWLTLVVALALCWRTDRRAAFRQRLADRARISEQEQALQTKDTKIAIIQARLETTQADERATREQLAEFISTQEDRAKIDVAPGLFRRLTRPE
jgi:hypothetical protein